MHFQPTNHSAALTGAWTGVWLPVLNMLEQGPRPHVAMVLAVALILVPARFTVPQTTP